MPIGLLAAISCSGARAQATGSRVLDHQVSGAGGFAIIQSMGDAISGPGSFVPGRVGDRAPEGSPVKGAPCKESRAMGPRSADGTALSRSRRGARRSRSIDPDRNWFRFASHRVLQAPERFVFVGIREVSSRTESTLSASAASRACPQIQPPPAMLPNANRSETWKTPYSYGYFGASGKRQWSLSHGYRDRYTQWELR